MTPIFDQGLLDTCISCGFCLPACPTYRETRLERSSPRGRITLMRALQDGRLDPDDQTLQDEASLCLGCRACEPVCPAGVRYGELLEQWRDHQWRGRHTPPVAAVLRAGVRVTPALGVAGAVRGAARTTGPADPERPHLMLGCVERSLFPGVSRAVQRLLPEVDVPSGQGCCGALHAHNGGSEQAGALAHELGEVMPGLIVSTAGGCAPFLAHHLGRDRVREVSEYLVERWAAEPAAVPDLRPVLVDGRPARVGVQDSCQLRNGLGVAATVRSLVARVAELVELPSAGACCGGAGTYSMLQPAMSAAVLAPHLDEAREAGLDYLVTVNPVCQRQMAGGARRARLGVQVLHLVELLAMALPDEPG
ncbi:MAG TPA: (Fe-S)-binding protein [Actinotalea sp.]|nr:(Fe-S)-binding protein [Actinotalea sp.]